MNRIKRKLFDLYCFLATMAIFSLNIYIYIAVQTDGYEKALAECQSINMFVATDDSGMVHTYMCTRIEGKLAPIHKYRKGITI